MKSLSSNKKAHFDYEVLDKIEAGISLFGWEVKSIKAGSMSLSSSFVIIRDGEVYIIDSFVPSWKSAPKESKEVENRKRKLLMTKSEIHSLEGKLKQTGFSAVPLEIYENEKGIIKVTVAVVRGKKRFDKRRKLKEKDLKRRVESERKQYNF